MKSVPCGYSMNPTWRSTAAAVELVAGLVGATCSAADWLC
jgi:hypothetical protein